MVNQAFATPELPNTASAALEAAASISSQSRCERADACRDLIKRFGGCLSIDRRWLPWCRTFA